ncbi:MAG: helix-turn-helix domain-containing protein [Candidatus Eisenbacteria sp.]|nr:helix-turn-helix domain-containing protein [Candidatus Eisenbacteria bacterium]
MPTKQVLARRIRETRLKRKMTLKQVEQLSGFSSTHISEIERGRTSPTIAALSQIAQALGKDPCYFIEEQEMEDVALSVSDPELCAKVVRGPLEIQSLSAGVLTSRLRFYRLRIRSPFKGRLDEIGAGDVCFYMLGGTLQVWRGAEAFRLGAGSSLHAQFAQPPGLEVTGGAAEVFISVDPAGLPADSGTSAPPRPVGERR